MTVKPKHFMEFKINKDFLESAILEKIAKKQPKAFKQPNKCKGSQDASFHWR